MKVVGNVPQLNHLGHLHHLTACGTHVNETWPQTFPAGTPPGVREAAAAPNTVILATRTIVPCRFRPEGTDVLQIMQLPA
jgi:hypothetical protein